MRKYLAFSAILLLLSGCYYYPYGYYDDNGYYRQRYRDRDDYERHDRDDYYRHGYSDNTKLHWHMASLGNGTVAAEGYIEPTGKTQDVNPVQLRLVGLDASGKVVNSAEGKAIKTGAGSPNYPGPSFRIPMKLNGSEKEFKLAMK